jgi:hypothetical protein
MRFRSAFRRTRLSSSEALPFAGVKVDTADLLHRSIERLDGIINPARR